MLFSRAHWQIPPLGSTRAWFGHVRELGTCGVSFQKVRTESDSLLRERGEGARDEWQTHDTLALIVSVASWANVCALLKRRGMREHPLFTHSPPQKNHIIDKCGKTWTWTQQQYIFWILVCRYFSCLQAPLTVGWVFAHFPSFPRGALYAPAFSAPAAAGAWRAPLLTWRRASLSVPRGRRR